MLPEVLTYPFYPSKFIHDFNVRRTTTGGGPWGLNPCPFLQKDKSAIFLENFESSVKKCIEVIIIKLEFSESRKFAVIFLPFLNLKNIIQSYILCKKIVVCPSLWIRPLPSKISSCAPGRERLLETHGAPR